MLTGPKKRPELTRTMRDLYKNFDNLPDNLTINAFYFGRGCKNCTHTELDIALERINKDYPFVHPIEWNFTKEYDFENKELVEEMYSSLERLHGDWNYKAYYKYRLVTDYFMEMITDALEKYADITDYFITLEDDMIFASDFLKVLFDDISHVTEDVCFYKACTPSCLYKKGYYSTSQAPPWGIYGNFWRTDKFKEFIRYIKLVKINECYDTLTVWYCSGLNKRIFIDCKKARHFGRDLNIPP